MAASEYTGFVGKRLLVEPKLDGYRLSAVVDAEGEVTFWCRGSQPAWAENLEHIALAISSLGRRSCMFDGEIMASTWNETSSLVRRKRALASDEVKVRMATELKFHIFDYVDFTIETIQVKPGSRRKVLTCFPLTQHQRRKLLQLALIGRHLPMIRLVESRPASSDEEVSEILADYMAAGYEGAIAKDPDGLYAFGERTSWWLKLKPVRTIDLTITGTVEGLGKHAGRLGALSCVNDDGQAVSVGGGFNDALRESLWARRALLVGLRVEVKCQAGDVATARHPVFVRFRNDQNPVEITV